MGRDSVASRAAFAAFAIVAVLAIIAVVVVGMIVAAKARPRQVTGGCESLFGMKNLDGEEAEAAGADALPSTPEFEMSHEYLAGCDFAEVFAAGAGADPGEGEESCYYVLTPARDGVNRPAPLRVVPIPSLRDVARRAVAENKLNISAGDAEAFIRGQIANHSKVTPPTLRVQYESEVGPIPSGSAIAHLRVRRGVLDPVPTACDVAAATHFALCATCTPHPFSMVHMLLTDAWLTIYSPCDTIRVLVRRGATEERAAEKSAAAVLAIAAAACADFPGATAAGEIARLRRAGVIVSTIPRPGGTVWSPPALKCQTGITRPMKAFFDAYGDYLARFPGARPVDPPPGPPPGSPGASPAGPIEISRLITPADAQAVYCAVRLHVGLEPSKMCARAKNVDILDRLAPYEAGWKWSALSTLLSRAPSDGTADHYYVRRPGEAVPGAPAHAAGAAVSVRPRGWVERYPPEARAIAALPCGAEWAAVLGRTLGPDPPAGAPYDVVVSHYGAVIFGPGPQLLEAAARAREAAPGSSAVSACARFSVLSQLVPEFRSTSLDIHTYALICARAGVAVRYVAGPDGARSGWAAIEKSKRYNLSSMQLAPLAPLVSAAADCARLPPTGRRP